MKWIDSWRVWRRKVDEKLLDVDSDVEEVKEEVDGLSEAVDGLGEEVGTLGTAVQGKLDKQYETTDAGKVLTVGNDGVAVPKEASGGDRLYKHCIHINHSRGYVDFVVITKSSTTITTFEALTPHLNFTTARTAKSTVASGVLTVDNVKQLVNGIRGAAGPKLYATAVDVDNWLEGDITITDFVSMTDTVKEIT